MQKQRSLWKLLIISFFAFLVVACKPIASFSVSPDPVKAGIEATFDASASMADVLPKKNAIKPYAWNFGDGSTGSGKVATHTYAAAGTFTVKLTVVDTAGRVGTTTENLVVISGDVVTPTTTLKVVTQIAGGVSLTGAEVTVGTATATSNADGLATLNAAPVGEDQVVTIKKAGYVTQSIRATLAAGTEPQQLLVLLMPEKDTLSITDIAAAQTISSNYLGASITVPAAAFVNATTGAAATSAATVKVTPRDIKCIDLQAMPGNGLARDASGNLVSAGMMSVEFFDAAGTKLQVATGKTATIQMDLPQGTTSIGGNPIAEGTSIPLWHFDATQGLWIEEGTGYVVATDTGLAVQAIVSHFSIWNWSRGYLYDTGSPTNVRCVTSSGALSACNLIALVTFNDGSHFTIVEALPALAKTFYIVPRSGGSVHWTATSTDGLIATATSKGNGNTIVLELAAPTTSNFVQCQLPDATPVAGEVSLSATLTDGSSASTDWYIPAAGANLATNWSINGSLAWWAVASRRSTDGTLWTNYTGAAASTSNGAVNIPLTELNQASAKTLTV